MRRVYFVFLAFLLVGGAFPISSDYPQIGQAPWLFYDEFDGSASGWNPVPAVTSFGGDYRYSVSWGSNASSRTYGFEYSGYYDLMIVAMYISGVGDIQIEFGSYLYNFTTLENLETDPEGRKFMVIRREQAVALGFHTLSSIRVSIRSGTWSSFGIKAVHVQGNGYVDAKPFEYNYLDAGTSEYAGFSSTNGFASQGTTNSLYLPYGLPSAPFNSMGTHQSKSLGMPVVAGLTEVDSYVSGGIYQDFFSAPAMFLESGSYEVRLGIAGASTVDMVNVTAGGMMTVEVHFEALGQRVLLGSQSARFNDFNSLSFRVASVPANVEGMLRVSVTVDSMLVESYPVQRDLYLYLYQFTVFRRAPADQLVFNGNAVDGSQTVFTDVSTVINGREAILLPSMAADFRVDAEGQVSRVSVFGKDNLHRNFEIRLYVYAGSWTYVGSSVFYSDSGMAIISVPAVFSPSFNDTLLRLQFLHPTSFFRLQGVSIGGPSPSIFEERSAAQLSASYANTSIAYDGDYVLLAESGGMPRPAYPVANPSFESSLDSWGGDGVVSTSASDGVKSAMLSATATRITSDTATQGSIHTSTISQLAYPSIYSQLSFDIKTAVSWVWDNYGSDTSPLPSTAATDSSSPYDMILFRAKVGSTVIWSSSSYYPGWTTVTVPFTQSGSLTFEVMVQSGMSEPQGVNLDPNGNGGGDGMLYFSVVPQASLWVDNIRLSSSLPRGVVASFDYLGSAFLDVADRVMFELTAKSVSNDGIARHFELAYQPTGGSGVFTLGSFTILASTGYTTARAIVDLAQLKSSISNLGWTRIELLLIPHESFLPTYISGFKAVELQGQVRGDQFTDVRIDGTPASLLQGMRDDREGHQVEWKHDTDMYAMKMTELPREHSNAKVALSEGGRPSLQQVDPSAEMLLRDTTFLPSSLSKPVVYEFRFEMNSDTLLVGLQGLFIDKTPGLQPRFNVLGNTVRRDVPTLQVGTVEHRLLFVIRETKVEAFLNGIRMGEILGTFDFGSEPQIRVSGASLTYFSIESLARPDYDGTGVFGDAYGQQRNMLLLPGNHLGYEPLGGRVNYGIQTRGSGTDNGFWFYVNRIANPSSAPLSIDIKMEGPFYIYIKVKTDVGITYLTYIESTTSPYASGGYLYLPLPDPRINDGSWRTFTVDVQSELRRMYPSGTVSEVEAFLIRGTAMLDNLEFQGEMIMDAEDPSANVGYIYDTSPSGAELSRVQYSRYAGILNRGIQVQGSGTDNGFYFYINRQALSSAVLSVDLKMAGAFVIYIKVSTNVGITYLTYNSATTSPGSGGAYAFLPLPDPDINDGSWRTFSVDVQTELQKVFPSGIVSSVEGFLIRGTATVDNLVFQGETIMDAEDPSANVGYIYDTTPAGASMTNVLYSREMRDYVPGNPLLQYFNSHFQFKLDIPFSGQKVYFANPAFSPSPSFIEFKTVGVYKEAILHVDGTATTFYRGLANESNNYWLSISTYPGRDGLSKLAVALWKDLELRPLGRTASELALGTPSQGHLLMNLTRSEILRPFFDPASGYIRIHEMQDGFRVEDNALSGVGNRFATYWLKQDIVNQLRLKPGGYLKVDGNLTHTIDFMMDGLYDFDKEYASFKVTDSSGELVKIRVIRNSTRNKIGGTLQVLRSGQWSDTGIDFELGRFVSLRISLNSTAMTYSISLNGIADRTYALPRIVSGTTSMRLEAKSDIYVQRVNDIDFSSSNSSSVDTNGFLDNSIGNANQYLTVELSATTRTKVILDFMGQSHEQLVYGEETLQVPVPLNQFKDMAVEISSDMPITVKTVSLTTAQLAEEFLYLTRGEQSFTRQGEVPITPLLDYTFEDSYQNTVADRDHLTYYGAADHYAKGAQGKAIVLDNGAYLQGQFSYQLPEFTVAFSAKFLEDPSLITSTNYQFMANAEGNGKVLFTIMYDPVLRLTIDSGTGSRLSYTAPIQIDNEWHRYVLIYNASHALLYRDGLLAINIPKPGWTVPTPSLFTIGSISNNDMMVDEYQLFADDYGANVETISSYQVPTSVPEFFSGFDGNTIDFSGSASQFNGILDYGKGIAGQAISFNGYTDTAIVQTSVMNDLTISFWFKASRAIGLQPLIYQKGVNPDNLRVGVALMDNRLSILYSDGSIKTVGNTIIETATWYHAVLTVEGNLAQLYLDNALVASLTHPFSPPLDEFKLGGIQAPQFQGMIDQLAVFATVLDVGQRGYLNVHHYGIQSSSGSFKNLLPTSSFLEPMIFDFEDAIVPDALVGTPYIYVDQGRLRFDWQGAPTGLHQTALNLYDDVLVRVKVSTLATGTSGAVVFGLFLENGTSVGTVEFRNGWKLTAWDGTSLSTASRPETLVFTKSGSYVKLRAIDTQGNVLLDHTLYSLSQMQFRILHEKQGTDLPDIRIESIEVHPAFSRGDATFSYVQDNDLYAGTYEVKTADLSGNPYDIFQVYSRGFAIGKGLSDLSSYAAVREKKEVASGEYIPSIPYAPERLTTADLLSIQYRIPSSGLQSFYLALDIYDPDFAPDEWGGSFTRTQWVRVVLDRNGIYRQTSTKDASFVVNWRDTQSPEGPSSADDLFFFSDTNSIVGGPDDIIEVIHPAKSNRWDVVTLELASLVQNYVGLRAVFVDTGGQTMRFIPNWHDPSVTGLFPAEGVKSSQNNEWNVIRASQTGTVALHNEIYDYRSNRYYATTFAAYIYSETEQRAYISYESSGIAVLEVGGDRTGNLVPIGLTPGRNLVKFRLVHLPSHEFEWNFKMAVLAPENVTISTKDDLDTNVQLATALRQRETVTTYNLTTEANLAYYPLDGSPHGIGGQNMVPTGVTYDVGYNDLGAVLDGNLRIPLQDWMHIRPRGFGMSMWIKPNVMASTQRLVDAYSWTLDLEYMNATASLFRLSWRDEGLWNSVTQIRAITGQWKHLTVSFGQEATLFIDGISNSSAMGRVDTPYRDWYVGSSYQNTMKYKGMVDEIHFFRKELTADDVSAIIAAGGIPQFKKDHEQFDFYPSYSYTFEQGDSLEENTVARYVEQFERSIAELTASGWTFVQPNANYLKTSKGNLDLVHSVQGTTEAWYTIDPDHTRLELQWFTNFTQGGFSVELLDASNVLMASIGYLDGSPFLRVFDETGTMVDEYTATGILPPVMHENAIMELRNGTLLVEMQGTFSRAIQLMEGRAFGTVKLKFTVGADPNAVMSVSRLETNRPASTFFGDGIAAVTKTFSFEGTLADLEEDGWQFVNEGTSKWNVVPGTLDYQDPAGSNAGAIAIYDPAGIVTDFDAQFSFSTTYMGIGAIEAYDLDGNIILKAGFSDGWASSNPKGYVLIYDTNGIVVDSYYTNNLPSSTLNAYVSVTMNESITVKMVGSANILRTIQNEGRTIDTVKFRYYDYGTVGSSRLSVDDFTVSITTSYKRTKVLREAYPGTFALAPHANLPLTQIDDPLEIYGMGTGGGSGWQTSEINFTPDQGFSGFIWDFTYNFASMGKILMYVYDSLGRQRIFFSIYDAWAGSRPGSHYYIYDEAGNKVHQFWSSYNYLPSSGTASFGVKIIGNTLHTNVTGVYSRSSINSFGSIDIGSIKVKFVRHASYNAPTDQWRLKPDTSTLNKKIQLESRWGTPQSGMTPTGSGIYLTNGDTLLTDISTISVGTVNLWLKANTPKGSTILKLAGTSLTVTAQAINATHALLQFGTASKYFLLDEWHMLTLTKSGNSYSLYLGATLVGTASFAGNPDRIQLGDPDDGFDMLIDNYRVGSNPLAASMVSKLFETDGTDADLSDDVSILRRIEVSSGMVVDTAMQSTVSFSATIVNDSISFAGNGVLSTDVPITGSSFTLLADIQFSQGTQDIFQIQLNPLVSLTVRKNEGDLRLFLSGNGHSETLRVQGAQAGTRQTLYLAMDRHGGLTVSLSGRLTRMVDFTISPPTLNSMQVTVPASFEGTIGKLVVSQGILPVDAAENLLKGYKPPKLTTTGIGALIDFNENDLTAQSLTDIPVKGIVSGEASITGERAVFDGTTNLLIDGDYLFGRNLYLSFRMKANPAIRNTAITLLSIPGVSLTLNSGTLTLSGAGQSISHEIKYGTWATISMAVNETNLLLAVDGKIATASANIGLLNPSTVAFANSFKGEIDDLLILTDVNDVNGLISDDQYRRFDEGYLINSWLVSEPVMATADEFFPTAMRTMPYDGEQVYTTLDKYQAPEDRSVLFREQRHNNGISLSHESLMQGTAVPAPAWVNYAAPPVCVSHPYNGDILMRGSAGCDVLNQNNVRIELGTQIMAITQLYFGQDLDEDLYIIITLPEYLELELNELDQYGRAGVASIDRVQVDEFFWSPYPAQLEDTSYGTPILGKRMDVRRYVGLDGHVPDETGMQLIPTPEGVVIHVPRGSPIAKAGFHRLGITLNAMNQTISDFWDIDVAISYRTDQMGIVTLPTQYRPTVEAISKKTVSGYMSEKGGFNDFEKDLAGKRVANRYFYFDKAGRVHTLTEYIMGVTEYDTTAEVGKVNTMWVTDAGTDHMEASISQAVIGKSSFTPSGTLSSLSRLTPLAGEVRLQGQGYPTIVRASNRLEALQALDVQFYNSKIIRREGFTAIELTDASIEGMDLPETATIVIDNQMHVFASPLDDLLETMLQQGLASLQQRKVETVEKHFFRNGTVTEIPIIQEMPYITKVQWEKANAMERKPVEQFTVYFPDERFKIEFDGQLRLSSQFGNRKAVTSIDLRSNFFTVQDTAFAEHIIDSIDSQYYMYEWESIETIQEGTAISSRLSDARISGIYDWAKKIKAVAKNPLEAISNIVDTVGDGIRKAIDTTTETVTNTAEELRQTTEDTIQDLSEVVDNAMNHAMQVGQVIGEKLNSIALEGVVLTQQVISQTMEALEAFGEFMAKAGDALVDTMVNGLHGLVEFVRDVADAVEEWFASQSPKQFFQNLIDIFRSGEKADELKDKEMSMMVNGTIQDQDYDEFEAVKELTETLQSLPNAHALPAPVDTLPKLILQTNYLKNTGSTTFRIQDASSTSGRYQLLHNNKKLTEGTWTPGNAVTINLPYPGTYQIIAYDDEGNRVSEVLTVDGYSTQNAEQQTPQATEPQPPKTEVQAASTNPQDDTISKLIDMIPYVPAMHPQDASELQLILTHYMKLRFLLAYAIIMGSGIGVYETETPKTKSGQQLFYGTDDINDTELAQYGITKWTRTKGTEYVLKLDEILDRLANAFAGGGWQAIISQSEQTIEEQSKSITGKMPKIMQAMQYRLALFLSGGLIVNATQSSTYSTANKPVFDFRRDIDGTPLPFGREYIIYVDDSDPNNLDFYMPIHKSMRFGTQTWLKWISEYFIMVTLEIILGMLPAVGLKDDLRDSFLESETAFRWLARLMIPQDLVDIGFFGFNPVAKTLKGIKSGISKATTFVGKIPSKAGGAVKKSAKFKTVIGKFEKLFIATKPGNLEIATEALSGLKRGPFEGLTKKGVIAKALSIIMKYIMQFIFKGIAYAVKLKFIVDFIKIVFKVLKSIIKALFWLTKGVFSIVKKAGAKAAELSKRILAKLAGIMEDLWKALSGVWKPSFFDFTRLKSGRASYDEASGLMRHADGGLFAKTGKALADAKGSASKALGAISGFLSKVTGILLDRVKPIAEFAFTLVKKTAEGTATLLRKYWDTVTAEPDGYGVFFKNKEKMHADMALSESRKISDMLACSPGLDAIRLLATACPTYILSTLGEQTVKINEKIPLNADLRRRLVNSGLYTETALKNVKNISPEQIIQRKMAIIYHYTNGKTLAEFISDTKIQKYFGTTDSNLLSKFYNIIESTKSDQIRQTKSVLDIVNSRPSKLPPFSPAKFKTSDAEYLEALILTFYERELAPYMILKTGQESISLTSLISTKTHGTINDDLINAFQAFYANDARDSIIDSFQQKFQKQITTQQFEEMIQSALDMAMQQISHNSIKIDAVAEGSDIMALTLKKTFPTKNDDISRLAQIIYDDLMQKATVNTVEEWKLTLRHQPDFAPDFSIEKFARLKQNLPDNAKEIFFPADKPSILADIDYPGYQEILIAGFALDRIDRLGRDWNQFARTLGMNGKEELFTLTKPLKADTAFELASDQLKNSLAQQKFGKAFNDLTKEEQDHIADLIQGWAKKMENSIAQHQMMEFMRTGRWLEVKNLGINFKQKEALADALANDHMAFKNVPLSATINTKAAGIPTIPVSIKGQTYNLIVEQNALFALSEINGIKRFGFTKYADSQGIVRQLPQEALELTSLLPQTALEDVLQKGISNQADLQTLGTAQELIFDLLFRTPGQGHKTNFMRGKWTPEFNAFVYGGHNAETIKEGLKKYKGHLPKAYDQYRSFQPKKVLENIEWDNAKQEKLVKYIQKRQTGKNFVIDTQGNINWVDKIAMRTDQPNLNKYHIRPIDGTIENLSSYKFQSIVDLFNALGINAGNLDQLTDEIRKMDTDQFLMLWGKLEYGHQYIRGGKSIKILSPIDGTTALVGTNYHSNARFLQFIEVKASDGTSDFILRHPAKVYVQNAKNLPTDSKTAQKILKNDRSTNMLADQLDEYIQYLSDETISALMKKHATANPVLALIEEFRKIADAADGQKPDLVPLKLKKEFEHLKEVLFVYDLERNPPQQFNAATLRIHSGHFIQSPDNVNLRPNDFSSNPNWIYQSITDYYEALPLWLEVRIRRILHTLTLGEDLLIQNFEAWKKINFGGQKGKRLVEIVGERKVWELAQRYLAPGAALNYISEEGRIIQSMGDRPFRYGTLLTPIFLSDELFKDGNKRYLELYERINGEPRNVDALKRQKGIYLELLELAENAGRNPFTQDLLVETLERMRQVGEIVLVILKRL